METTKPDPRRDHVRQWLFDLVAGGVLGGLAGAIVAVNVVIYSGVESGYQASPGDVFGHSVLIGILVVAILVGTPVLGVFLARRRRRMTSRS